MDLGRHRGRRGRCDPAEFDSMIAKVIATGASPMKEGPASTEPSPRRRRRARRDHQQDVPAGPARPPVVRDGRADTGWLDRLTPTDDHIHNALNADVALVAAALDAAACRTHTSDAIPRPGPAVGRPHVDAAVGQRGRAPPRTTRLPGRARWLGAAVTPSALAFDARRAWSSNSSAGPRPRRRGRPVVFDPLVDP